MPGEDTHYRIVILGGGTAGWMAAAGLVRRLRADAYSVTLVESEEIGTVGVGEATLPHLRQFNEMLGLDEASFMRATNATFKLGIEFVGWDRPDGAYIHPFGAFGEPWGGVQFQQHWLRLRDAGRAVAPFQAYSMAVAAARAGVFELPDKNPASVRSTYSHAFHFDSARYAELLRKWATERGVLRIEGRVARVEREPDNGAITALTLENGSRAEGDLFIDCSGFRSLLLGQELGVQWEDWRQWLPCNRAIAVGCDHATAEITPYTRATARSAGWQWRIPLQHRIGNGYVFCSDFASGDEARQTLLANLDGKAQGEPKLLRFMPGRRVSAWEKNCVGIGLSSGFLEPLESTSIFLIQAAVLDLLDLLPRPGTPDPRLAAEFNRLSAMQYERVRDFLILHYVANRRTGEPLWDYLRTMPIPDSLAHKLALFRARAAVPEYEFGLFSRDSWLSVLFGQGIEPEAYDPLADAFDLDRVEARCGDFKARIDAAVAAMASHRAFIERYCAQSERAAA
jgi:tryptophan halogenase